MHRSPAHADESPTREVDPVEHAISLAYRYLDRRDRTVDEVRRYLAGKALAPEVIEEALNSLQEQRALDDVRFARLFTEDKRALEQWGSARIRSTLLARGVDRDTIEATLGARSPESELEQAVELLNRRFPKPPQERRERDRAIGVLMRKGYDADIALDALSSYARADQSGDQG